MAIPSSIRTSGGWEIEKDAKGCGLVVLTTLTAGFKHHPLASFGIAISRERIGADWFIASFWHAEPFLVMPILGRHDAVA